MLFNFMYVVSCSCNRWKTLMSHFLIFQTVGNKQRKNFKWENFHSEALYVLEDRIYSLKETYVCEKNEAPEWGTFFAWKLTLIKNALGKHGLN